MKAYSNAQVRCLKPKKKHPCCYSLEYVDIDEWTCGHVNDVHMSS